MVRYHCYTADTTEWAINKRGTILILALILTLILTLTLKLTVTLSLILTLTRTAACENYFPVR